MTFVVLVACSSGQSVAPPTTTIVDGKSLPVMRYQTCKGDCEAGVMVGDVFEAASGQYLKPQYTDGPLVAVGLGPNIPDQARHIPTVASPWLLAVRESGTWTLYYGFDNEHFPSRADMEKVFSMVCDPAGLPYSTVTDPPGTERTPC